jgi:hypothetical protein
MAPGLAAEIMTAEEYREARPFLLQHIDTVRSGSPASPKVSTSRDTAATTATLLSFSSDARPHRAL